MADVTLDLATRVIPSDHVIWAVFPGRGRRFTEAFINNDAVFLDIPGIRLTPELLHDDDRLRKHIAMSEAISESYHGGPAAPSRHAAGYPAKRGGSMNAAVGNVKNMYLRMKPDDLVIMAGRSIYGEIHAGEITKPFNADDTIEGVYSRDDIPYRRVRWFDDLPQRRFLSERLSQRLSNRKAVISIEKEEFADEVYRLVYGDYVYGDESRYIFEGPTYKGFPPATVPGIQLLSYFLAASNAYDRQELDGFRDLSISDAIAKYAESDGDYSFEIDFSSPGEYVIRAKNAAKASVVALLVAVSADNISYTDARAATIVNSANRGSNATISESCPVPIQQEFKTIMDSIGATRHNEACAINKAAQKGVGLRVHVKVKK